MAARNLKSTYYFIVFMLTYMPHASLNLACTHCKSSLMCFICTCQSGYAINYLLVRISIKTLCNRGQRDTPCCSSQPCCTCLNTCYTTLHCLLQLHATCTSSRASPVSEDVRLSDAAQTHTHNDASWKLASSKYETYTQRKGPVSVNSTEISSTTATKAA